MKSLQRWCLEMRAIFPTSLRTLLLVSTLSSLRQAGVSVKKKKVPHFVSHFAVKCPDWMFQTGKKMYLYAVQTIGGLIHDLHFRNKVALWMHYCQMCIFLLKTSKWTLSLSKDTDESKWYDAISVIFIIVSAFCSIHLMLTINPFLSGFWNVEWSPST